MQKPGSFSEPPPTVTADWGFYGPRIITTPAVLHSAWRVGDSVAVLFANTTCDPVTVQFTPRLEAWGLPGQTIEALELQEGAASSAVQLPREASRGVTVPPYGLTAWLLTDGDPLAEGHAAKVAAAAALFGVLKGIDDEAGMTPESKRAELDKRNPWTVPGTPVRSAAEWIEASQAPKLVRAKVSPDGTFVGWIADGGSLCFGPVDLGAGGEPVLECEVAVPPTTTNGRLRLMESVDGKGVTLGEAKLESTGGYQTYGVVRLPLPEDVSGVRSIVLQVAGSGGGICNVRRWRVVREG